jgi:hypothetical protein
METSGSYHLPSVREKILSTKSQLSDRISMLHKRQPNTDFQDEPKAGQRGRLCSNNVGIRCPALDFEPNGELVTNEMLVDYLASILVEGFLELIKDERNKKKSSIILPGFDEGTS